jgi:TrmH family RNA methyltransferase
MLSRNAVKFVNSLKIKKYRQEHKAFIVEGEKMVDELLQSHLDILTLYALEEWITEHRNLTGQQSAQIVTVSMPELGKISDLVTPNKVLATVRIPEKTVNPALNLQDFVLVLDSIRDPGNMGTIIRTADWFGVRNIICSSDCVDIYNPKVVQATMGSYMRVNVHYMDLVMFLKEVPSGIPVYGALLKGQSVFEKKFIKPGVLVIGNESRGISASLLPLISDPVFIPPYLNHGAGSYRAESLNASIANAIICYEIRKQLSKNKF